MKTVKWVDALIKEVKLERLAVRKVDGREQFSMVINDDNGHLIVRREGTIILHADIHTKEVFGIGGSISRTDSIYINQIMDSFGMYHPHLRYVHTRNMIDEGVTLVNLYPKMIFDTNYEQYHRLIADLVSPIYGQAVISEYSFEDKEFRVVTQEGKTLYSLEHDVSMSFLNEKGKVEHYKLYFTGEKLCRIAMRRYLDEVTELIEAGYFDIQYKATVQ